MSLYRITRIYNVVDTFEVEADSTDEAVNLAMDADITSGVEPEYMPDSMDIDTSNVLIWNKDTKKWKVTDIF